MTTMSVRSSPSARLSDATTALAGVVRAPTPTLTPRGWFPASGRSESVHRGPARPGSPRRGRPGWRRTATPAARRTTRDDRGWVVRRSEHRDLVRAALHRARRFSLGVCQNSASSSLPARATAPQGRLPRVDLLRQVGPKRARAIPCRSPLRAAAQQPPRVRRAIYRKTSGARTTEFTCGPLDSMLSD